MLHNINTDIYTHMSTHSYKPEWSFCLVFLNSGFHRWLTFLPFLVSFVIFYFFQSCRLGSLEKLRIMGVYFFICFYVILYSINIDIHTCMSTYPYKYMSRIVVFFMLYSINIDIHMYMSTHPYEYMHTLLLWVPSPFLISFVFFLFFFSHVDWVRWKSWGLWRLFFSRCYTV
jgi:hypothetical protein